MAATREVASEQEPQFARSKHIQFIKGFFKTESDEKKETPDLKQLATAYLKLSGLYWGVMALELVSTSSECRLDRDTVVNFVLSCHHPYSTEKEDGERLSSTEEELARTQDVAEAPPRVLVDASVLPGGFGGSPNHDPHILYTTSAVQLLAIYDALDRVDADAVAAQIASLQLRDGSFQGDCWGEVDTRFSYCAILTLSILKRLHFIDTEKAANYILRCKNFDGGYGCVAGAESHAGMIFVCVGSLALLHRLDLVDRDQLSWWLCERQCDSGGLNGRPEKQADVCYSWWILSVLSIIGRTSWVDKQALTAFILRSQDCDDGGIADRPDNMPDPFHTYFGIAGLVFLGHFLRNDLPHKEIDPAYALPVEVVRKLDLRPAARLQGK